MRRLVGLFAVLVAATAAEGQTLGTFRWQLQPYCNVLTVTVVQQGGQYQVDGTDDQCGAAQQASVVGRAFPNPDGSIGFGLTTVTTTAATAIHIDARLNVATLGGTWRDSAGNSGAFAFRAGAGTGGSPRPVPAGGIAPGTITAAQLAPTAVAGAVGALGTCPTGQYLRGFQGGVAVCEPIGVPPTGTTVDPGPANAGIWPSIVLGSDGLPIVAHRDGTNGDLRITHCNNLACSIATTTAVETANDVGWTPSIAVGASGFPVVSHYDATNGDLRLTRCLNVTCTSATSVPLDVAGNVGRYSSIAIGVDGFPVISHYDMANADLRVTHCTDAACAGTTSAVVYAAGNAGFSSAIAIDAGGRPVIAFAAYDGIATTALRLARCADAACSSATSVALETFTDLGEIELVLVAGRPWITWVDDSGMLRLTQCADSTCSSWTTRTLGPAGRTSTAVGPDGVLTIAYESTNGLSLIHCDDAACTTFTDTLVEATSSSGADPDLTFGSDGLPVVAFRDLTGLDLRMIKCNSRTCR